MHIFVGNELFLRTSLEKQYQKKIFNTESNSVFGTILIPEGGAPCKDFMKPIRYPIVGKDSSFFAEPTSDIFLSRALEV